MSERQPIQGKHHLERTREPYYRIVEGNLPEIADEPKLLVKEITIFERIKRKLGK